MSDTYQGEAGVQASLTEMLGVYSIAELVYSVRNLKTASTFLLDHNFPNMIESTAPEVAIDVDVGKRRMAPFCSPLVEGKPVASRKFTTNLFRPPYIKDLRNPDLLKPVRRQIGERIGGALTPMQRLEANLQWEIEDQIDMIDRRCEWMAAQALSTGKITVTGDGYLDPIEIDFNRDPALTVALSGAAQWGQTGIYPSDYVLQWAQTVLQKSGSFPTEITFTTSAWNAFKNDVKVLNSIIWPGKVGASTIELGGRIEQGGVYMGRWGQFDLYLYNDWYVDPDTDEENPMLIDGTILMGGAGVEGTRAFGMIMDPDFAYGPLAYAPKIWTEKNPALINMLMQSAPIMIPSRVNASFAATVMAPGAGVPGPTGV